MFRSSNFDKNLDNACSHLRLEPDWPSILELCDLIRQNDVSPKQAVQSIKKKMQSPNPHTALYSLMVLESVVKNCGSPIHDEISTKENCEMFSSLIESTPHENVKTKMLELIQAWAYAFRSLDKYQAIKDTMTILKTKGHTFPALKEADAMFTSDTAPGWHDGKCCHRCRVEFTFTQRKHHCRNCGQIFCAQCSSNTCTLPKFGIEKEVRVCEGCYINLQKPATAPLTQRGVENPNDLPAEYLTSSLAQQAQTPQRKTDQELKEEEELQLALALSQSEAEIKKTQSSFRPTYRKTSSPETGITTGGHNAYYHSSSPVSNDIGGFDDRNADPELAKYLNRDYWEQRGNGSISNGKSIDSPASPSAPSPMVTPQPSLSSTSSLFALKSETEDTEIDTFVSTMRTQVEIFVNRMKSDSSRGRSISTDSSVQTLFLNLTAFHSRLLGYIKDSDDKRMWYEQLQDKLTQIKDSRAALDVLRQEHQEKLRQQAEEQERQRQMQMAYKLELMRKKKQEYLQYQRQLALQRIQEQEREMQIHQEQQKIMYNMGAQSYGPPGASFISSPPPNGTTAGHLINSGVIANPIPTYSTPQGMTMYAIGPQSLGPQSMGSPSIGPPQSIGSQPIGRFPIQNQPQMYAAIPGVHPSHAQHSSHPPHPSHPQQPAPPNTVGIPLPGQYQQVATNPSNIQHNTSLPHQPQLQSQQQQQQQQQPSPAPVSQTSEYLPNHGQVPPGHISHHPQQPPQNQIPNQGLVHPGGIYSGAIIAGGHGVLPQQQAIGAQNIPSHQQGVPNVQPQLQQIQQPVPPSAPTQLTNVAPNIAQPKVEPEQPKENVPHVVEAELISFD